MSSETERVERIRAKVPTDGDHGCCVIDVADMQYLFRTLDAANARADAAGRWIPVAERLPEKFVPVLAAATFSDGKQLVGEATLRDDDKWFWETSDPDGMRLSGEGITHWQPLPAAPKGTNR